MMTNARLYSRSGSVRRSCSLWRVGDHKSRIHIARMVSRVGRAFLSETCDSYLKKVLLILRREAIYKGWLRFLGRTFLVQRLRLLPCRTRGSLSLRFLI